MLRAIRSNIVLIAIANTSFAFCQDVEVGQTRRITDPTDLRRWLENMVWHHGFSREEILDVTGLQPSELDDALRQYRINPSTKPLAEVDPPIFVLPYPGGRHPRI
jgi:hypothetical protein